MRKVIVNSTPLIALSEKGQLDLLKNMYGEIIIPKAVYLEVTAKNDIVKALLESNRQWIHVEDITSVNEKVLYRSRLHEGEVEVMILAQEMKADLVVIDDGAARKMAEYLNLPLTGTIGVIIKAQQEGLIEDAVPLINQMRAKGIYFSERLIEMVKRLSKNTGM